MKHLQSIQQLVADCSAMAPRSVATDALRLSMNLLFALICTCMVGVLNGCAGGIGSTSDRSQADARLTAQVKAALVGAPELAAAAIDVVSRDGSVRLSGFVETAAQRERARDLAGAVAGVKAVENRIKVK